MIVLLLLVVDSLAETFSLLFGLFDVVGKQDSYIIYDIVILLVK